MYRLIVADPAWPYNDRREVRRDNPSRKPTFGVGVERRYSAGTMTIADLCDLGPFVGRVAAPDAYLLMWATCPLLPQAFEVMAAWGFRYVTIDKVWIKVYPGLFARAWFTLADLARMLFRGPGYYTPSNVELVLLGVRGKPWHSTQGSKPGQVFHLPHPRQDGKIIHSRKPPEFQDAWEAWLGPHLDGAGKLELFATQPRPGWTCLGHAVTGRDLFEDLDLLAKSERRSHGICSQV